MVDREDFVWDNEDATRRPSAPEVRIPNSLISRPRSSSVSVHAFGNDDSQSFFRPRSASGVLERIIDEDFQLSVLNNNANNPTIDHKYEELTSYLKRGSKDFENRVRKDRKSSLIGKTRETLESVVPRYNKRYDKLMKLMSVWKPQREVLIQDLANFMNKLDRNSKLSTFIRFVSSSVDVSGTVGGMLFRSHSETGWAGQALHAASFFGLCGLVSTVAEVEQSKRILDEVTSLIESDHKLLKPIVEWFNESEHLDSIVQAIFPHGIDKEIVQQIQEASEEQDEYLKIFKAALVSNAGKNTEFFHDRDFLHSLQLFASSELASLWWNRIVYRKHPIILDFSRMALQIEFGQMQSIIFQCIPALPLEQQRLSSLPVAGRVMLNLLTMYDSFIELKKGAKSVHSDKLKKHLYKLQNELRSIEDTVNMMRPITF